MGFENNFLDFSNLNLGIPPIIPSPQERATREISTKIMDATDTIIKNNLISEIDKLNYQLEQKKHEKDNFLSRKKAIEQSSVMKKDFVLFKYIALFSIVIPFLLKILLNFFNNGIFKMTILVYIFISFFVSMLEMYRYLKRR